MLRLMLEKSSDIVVDAVDDVTDIGKTADTVTDAGKAWVTFRKNHYRNCQKMFRNHIKNTKM